MVLTTTQEGHITKTNGPPYGWVNRLRAPKILPGAIRWSRSGRGCSYSLLCSLLPLKGNFQGERMLAAQKFGPELGLPSTHVKCWGVAATPVLWGQRKEDH